MEEESTRRAVDWAVVGNAYCFWKDADRGIPIFKQAKAEYTKLQRFIAEICSPTRLEPAPQSGKGRQYELWR